VAWRRVIGGGWGVRCGFVIIGLKTFLWFLVCLVVVWGKVRKFKGEGFVGLGIEGVGLGCIGNCWSG